MVDVTYLGPMSRSSLPLGAHPALGCRKPTGTILLLETRQKHRGGEMLGLLNRRLVSPIQPGRSDPKPLRHPEVALSTWSRSRAKRRNPLTTYSNTN